MLELSDHLGDFNLKAVSEAWVVEAHQNVGPTWFLSCWVRPGPLARGPATGLGLACWRAVNCIILGSVPVRAVVFVMEVRSRERPGCQSSHPGPVCFAQTTIKWQCWSAHHCVSIDIGFFWEGTSCQKSCCSDYVFLLQNFSNMLFLCLSFSNCPLLPPETARHPNR